jgi:acetylcholinesterase
MIVVTFNYRVGLYGFLASEDVRRDGDLNVGLLDQRKAMEWTKNHIASFGGDPNHIVLMGTSSGGGSVLYHLAAYDGKPTDLFVGAIASSSYVTRILPVPQLEFQYQQLLNATSCSSITCLRTLPGEQLQAANLARPYPGSGDVALFTYAPCLDGTFFSQTPVSLFKNGRFAAVPLLIGNTEDEGTIFELEANTTAQVSTDLKTQYPELTGISLNKINELYPYDAKRQNPVHTPYFASASAAYGEGIMTCPSLHVARAITSKISPVAVWDYRYNVRDPANIAAGLGVPHTFEIDAVWGPGFAVNPAGSNSYTGANAAIVPIVQGYWQSFIRDLDPNTYRAPGSPKWQPLANNNWLLIETNATRMAWQSQDEARRCDFWDLISPSLYQ